MFNNSVCFGADGSMTINNGYQTIKMGNGGMSIQNTGGPHVVMNNNGMQVFRQQNSFSGYCCPAQNVITYTTYTSNQPQYAPTYFTQLPVQQVPLNTYTYNHTVYSQGQHNPTQAMSFPSQPATMGWQYSQTMNIPQPNIYYNPVPQNIQPIQAQSQPRGLTKEQINQLPVCVYAKNPTEIKKFKSKGNEQSDDKNNESSSINCCSICIGDYEVGEKVTTLPCIHRFHKECIDKWLEVKSECPVCKYDLLS